MPQQELAPNNTSGVSSSCVYRQKAKSKWQYARRNVVGKKFVFAFTLLPQSGYKLQSPVRERFTSSCSGRRRRLLHLLGAVPRAAPPLRHVLPLRVEVRLRGDLPGQSPNEEYTDFVH